MSNITYQCPKCGDSSIQPRTPSLWWNICEQEWQIDEVGEELECGDCDKRFSLAECEVKL